MKEKKKSLDSKQKLPLLDEVHDLIEKERFHLYVYIIILSFINNRTLLSLRLLEEQQQKEEWKNKYDSLLIKLNDPHLVYINCFQ